mmetsp:Transcript_24036/g.49152  ORF Transcript_24036/g.49152 Transcript_24036/m.49152 type:complete len:107 (-) Transcript_24036:1120-1440(-)
MHMASAVVMVAGKRKHTRGRPYGVVCSRYDITSSLMTFAISLPSFFVSIGIQYIEAIRKLHSIHPEFRPQRTIHLTFGKKFRGMQTTTPSFVSKNNLHSHTRAFTT